jgi:hypothetical protein
LLLDELQRNRRSWTSTLALIACEPSQRSGQPCVQPFEERSLDLFISSRRRCWRRIRSSLTPTSPCCSRTG